jgi:hypothetical protein
MPPNDCRISLGLLRKAHSDDVVIMAAPPHNDQVVIALNEAWGMMPWWISHGARIT